MPKLELYGKRDKAAWRDMQRALGLLLLSVEGTLAQSRAASQWDGNVPGYGGTVDGCPCTADCSPDNAVGVEQTGTSAVVATFASRVLLKFAYLTDQDGTIISYKAGDNAWSGPLSTITFEWDASEQPTGVVPHIVYADSCADVQSTVGVSTWVRQVPHPRPATTARARTQHALRSDYRTITTPSPIPGLPSLHAHARTSMLGPPQRRVPCASMQSRTARHPAPIRVPSQHNKIALLTQTYDARKLESEKALWLYPHSLSATSSSAASLCACGDGRAFSCP